MENRRRILGRRNPRTPLVRRPFLGSDLNTRHFRRNTVAMPFLRMSVRATLVVATFAALGALDGACGSDGTAAPPSDGNRLACGPGTKEVDHQCVAAGDASDGGSGAKLDAAHEATVEAGPDAEAPVHALDPCTANHRWGGCYDNKVYECEFGSPNDPGRVSFNPFRECGVLGGTCVSPPQSTGIPAYCTGGGYTPCSLSTDLDVCVDAHIVKHCDPTPIAGTAQTVWAAQDCRANGPTYVCAVGPNPVTGPSTVAGCRIP